MDKNTKIDPEDLQAAVVDLKEIHQAETNPFYQFKTSVDSAKTVFGEDNWSGEFVTSFRENFLGGYEDVADNQKKMVNDLQAAVDDYQSMLKTSYKDMDEILDEAKTALKKIIDDGEAFMKDFFVTGLAAGVGGGGGLALAGAAISIAGVLINAPGSDLDAVENHTKKVLDQIVDNMKAFDDEMVDLLADDYGMITNSKEGIDSAGNKSAETRRFELPRPGFAAK